MMSLERALVAQLFVRHRNGYDLTAAGKELLELAEGLEQQALAIERWRTASDPHPVVKIAAGAWMSKFIAGRIAEISDRNEDIAIEILTGVSPADLLRREANLGLRNRRPDMPGLAGKRLLRIEFAVFGEAALVRDHPETTDERRFSVSPWIAFSPAGPKAPSAVWLDQQLGRPARLRCSTAQAVLDAALAGHGLCVLPCFIGDAEPALARASGTIPPLSHDQWLVTHDDDRHDKRIRKIASRLTRLIQSQAPLFAGRS